MAVCISMTRIHSAAGGPTFIANVAWTVSGLGTAGAKLWREVLATGIVNVQSSLLKGKKKKGNEYERWKMEDGR